MHNSDETKDSEKTNKQKINDKRRKSAIILLVLILLLAFALRMYNTNELSGGDDSQFAEVARFAHQDINKLFYPSFPDEPTSLRNLHYPRIMAVLPLYLSILLFGFSKYAIVLPSVLFTLGSIIVLYVILKTWFNEKVAIISSLLLGVSPFHVAFTRSGLLHSQLLFFDLMIFYFVFKYYDDKNKGKDYRNVKYIYYSAIFMLMVMVTTEYRGLVPLFALIPYALMKGIDRKTVLHGIAAVTSAVMIYILYASVPSIFFNDTRIIDALLRHTQHAMGIIDTYDNYLTFGQALKLMGSYFIFTPFLGLIIVPMIAGVIVCFKKFKDSKYMFWIFYILASAIFYIQGQPYIDRQLIFTPGYTTLAAIGIWHTYKSFKSNGKAHHLFYPLFMTLTACYILLLPIMFTTFIPEYKNLLPQFISEARTLFLLTLILIVIIFSVLFLMRSINQYKAIAIKISIMILMLFLLANIIVPTYLVMQKVGIYHRPNETKIVAEFLKNNQGNEKYGCIAYNHDKTFAFYTGKLCMHWRYIDLPWLKEQAERGNLKYFITNIYQQSVGITNKETDANLEKYHKEMYEWLMNNSVDVTVYAGLEPDNKFFKVYQYVQQQ